MEQRQEFDVFVSHNSTDITTVEGIARQLKGRHLRVWLDLWECAPGTPFLDTLEQGLRSSSSVTIMLGPDETRPWVAAEIRASIDRAVKGQLRVIPVLLPGHPAEPRLPLFLQAYPWVDMRGGITEEGLDNLVWGITGRPPARLAMEVLPAATATSSALAAAGRPQNMIEGWVDAWGIAAVKRNLHISSEIIALDAASSAAMAAKTYPCDVLTMFVPLLVDLRWRRGYASALKRLLKPTEATRKIGDFTCSEATPPCPTDSGMLSARRDGPDRVVVCIQGQPAGIVSGLSEQEAAAVEDSVNRYGRLGVPTQGGLSAFERIKAIGVSMEQQGEIDELAQTLYRQRDVLIPLLARWGIPGDKCLLMQEEAYPTAAELTQAGGAKVADGGQVAGKGARRGAGKPSLQRSLPADPQQAEEIAVRGAWAPMSLPPSLTPEALQVLLKRLGDSTSR